MNADNRQAGSSGDEAIIGRAFRRSLLALLLLLSACFSGSETALMSLNRYQLRHKAREGHRGARLAEKLLKNPGRVIGLILLGNNLVNIFAASLVALVAFEIGAGTEGPVAERLTGSPLRLLGVRKDLAGIPRVVVTRRR